MGDPHVMERSADYRGEVSMVDDGGWGHPWARGLYWGRGSSTSSPGGQLQLTCRPPAVWVASWVQDLPPETKLAIAPLCHAHHVLGTHDTILPFPAPDCG